MAMAKKALTLCGLQLFACVLGMLAGFVPGISFTELSSGMTYWSGNVGPAGDDRRARVLDVAEGSPAHRAGFRTGDIIHKPATHEGVTAALKAVQRGENQTLTIKRGVGPRLAEYLPALLPAVGPETALVIEAARPTPELAAVWYAHLWYPIAGALFLCLGILVFATGPLVPAPLWRSILVAIAGLGIAAGFGLDFLRGSSIFSRVRIYEKYPLEIMGNGDEWYFQQGLIGMPAGILLAMLAAAEIRQRLAKPPTSTEPVK
jgi:hypothetical protein